MENKIMIPNQVEFLEISFSLFKFSTSRDD